MLKCIGEPSPLRACIICCLLQVKLTKVLPDKKKKNVRALSGDSDLLLDSIYIEKNI